MAEDTTKEIGAMKKVAEALEELSEEERGRVFAWAYSKFKLKNTPSKSPSIPGQSSVLDDGGDFSDIAEQNGEELRIICSDLKAKTIKDAALRVAYIVCYLRKKLLNEEKTSIEDILSQVKYQGAKDTNTSNHIGSQRDLPKDDGLIKLTKPAELKAIQYITEIRNSELKGEWKHTTSSSSKKKSKKASLKKS